MSQREYDQIPIPKELNAAVMRGIEEGRRLKRQNKRRKRMACLGGMAALLALSVGVCTVNPALAGKIPLIGHIFQRVEQSIPYPGNYSEKSGILREPETNVQEGETKKVYQVTDQGLTLTASEVYWNATEVSVTLAIEYDRLGEMGFYQEGYETSSYDAVQMMGQLLLNGKEVGTELDLYGRQTDKRTFVGVGKIPLESWEEGASLELELSVQTIWWNDRSNAYQGQEGASDFSSARWCEGTWNLTIPVSETVDADDQVRKIDLEETNADGFGFGTLTITDYEIQVEMIVPELSRKERAEFYQKAMEQAEKALGKEEAKKFYADAWFEPEDELHCGVAAYDQDGNRIPNGDTASFEVQGRSITKISLYLLPDDVTAMKEKTLEQVKACALYQIEVKL